MSRLITTVTIPEFIHRIKLSNSQRPKYFSKGQRIPKKYKKPQYIYKSFKLYGKTKQLLIDRTTGKRVIANPIAINKAKYMVVGFNQLYSGNLHHSQRKQIVNQIHKCMYPYAKHLKP